MKKIFKLKKRICIGCNKLFFTRATNQKRCGDIYKKIGCSYNYTKIRERNRRQEKRKIVLEHYSKGKPKCVCCGEKIIQFLSIDHINGGGTKHRRKIIKSHSISDWIIKNNFPKGFQILCHNCNQAKGYYGICPHKVAKAVKEKLTGLDKQK